MSKIIKMNKVKLPVFGLSLLALGITFNSCKPTPGDVSITTVVQANFSNAVIITVNEDCIVLRSNGLPNHKTPYWGVGNASYEDFPAGHAPNVNTTMIAQNYTMTIPTNPNEATNKEATSLGEIGMALNGVAIFNDREGGNVPLDAMTLTTFDYSGAHPAPGKNYHYHTTGRYTSVDDARLIGFLRDGYPIYGRKDTTGVYPTLDAYGGHIGPTQDFPEGIYHYHASNVNYLNSGYYILKAGSYYGTKGTFTN
jgi:YHYH protein